MTLRTGTGALLAACLWLTAGSASAAIVTVSFEGTVNGASTDLSGVLSPGDPVTGSFTLDTGGAGVFTPAGDPTFLRDNMVYGGAVTAIDFVLGGETLAGAGDVELNDSGGSLAGEDEYLVRTTALSGQIGGFAAVDASIALGYAFDTFDVDAGTALFAPPPLALSTFPLFSINLDAGRFVFGPVTSMTVVPLPAAAWLLASGLIVVAGLGRRRRA